MHRLTINQAITDIQAGKFILIVDDENRENEGDLMMGAQFVSPDSVNFMTRYGRGLVCVPMAAERLDALHLPLMVPEEKNTSGFGTAFTVSVEARTGVTTGISAHDRAHTIRTLANPQTVATDLSRPGHIFPLRANPDGVLGRAGQTEASVDLMRLAGLEPVATICEVMAEDGTMARLPALEEFAATNGIGIVTTADLIAYRQRHDPGISRGPGTRLPTVYGDFQLTAFDNPLYPDVDLALTMGEIASDEPVLVRLHSECLTGDVFGSRRCDCGEQLQVSMKLIAAEGRGVILYLRQEGRGIGLRNKLMAYALQDQGLDTIEANERLGFAADLRSFGPAVRMLRNLGVSRVRLLTNNPGKIAALEDEGIELVDRVPVVTRSTPDNSRYLNAKRDKLGHFLQDIVSADVIATP